MLKLPMQDLLHWLLPSHLEPCQSEAVQFVLGVLLAGHLISTAPVLTLEHLDIHHDRLHAAKGSILGKRAKLLIAPEKLEIELRLTISLGMTNNSTVQSAT